jgi:hypothetical protein
MDLDAECADGAFLFGEGFLAHALAALALLLSTLFFLRRILRLSGDSAKPKPGRPDTRIPQMAGHFVLLLGVYVVVGAAWFSVTMLPGMLAAVGKEGCEEGADGSGGGGGGGGGGAKHSAEL